MLLPGAKRSALAWKTGAVCLVLLSVGGYWAARAMREPPRVVQADPYLEARAAYEQGDYGRVVRILESETEFSGEQYGLLGQAFYRLGEYEKAATALRVALVLQPGRAEYRQLLSRAYVEIGRRKVGE